MSATHYRLSHRALVAAKAGGPWRFRLWLCWHILAGHTLYNWQNPLTGELDWWIER